MDKCKFCGAELEENSTRCPSCGADNGQIEAVEPAEASEGSIPAEEVQAEEEKTAEEKPEQKGILVTPGKLAVAAAVFVVLIAVIAALVAGGMNGKKNTADSSGEGVSTEATEAPTVPADGNPDDATCKGTYTASDDEVLAAAEKVVARAGAHELTNEQLQIFYWTEVWQFLSQYGNYAQYLGLDLSQSLDVQTCGVVQGRTWQQFFLESAFSRWHQCLGLYEESKENGYVLDEESQAELDNTLNALDAVAAANGIADGKQLLKDRMGAGATADAYVHLQNLQYNAYGYLFQQQEKTVISNEEAERFFMEHEAEYADQGLTKDTCTVDVRHILVMPVSADETATEYTEEEWAACEAEAQKILDEWLAGDKTENSFAALANEKSVDPGSNTNGGLYEKVQEGQMVETFNDWCFDPARQVGDYGIVTTNYGCHVMYFVGSETIWQETAKADLLDAKMEALISNAVDKYPMEIDYSAVVLGSVDFNS